MNRRDGQSVRAGGLVGLDPGVRSFRVPILLFGWFSLSPCSYIVSECWLKSVPIIIAIWVREEVQTDRQRHKNRHRE